MFDHHFTCFGYFFVFFFCSCLHRAFHLFYQADYNAHSVRLFPAFKIKGWNLGSLGNSWLVDESWWDFILFLFFSVTGHDAVLRARWKIYLKSCLKMSPFSAGNAFVAGRQGGYAIAPAANCKFSIIIFYYSLFFCWKFCFRRRFCHTRKTDSGCPFPPQTAGTGDATTLSTATTTTGWRRATRSAAGRPAWSGGGAVWAAATVATGGGPSIPWTRLSRWASLATKQKVQPLFTSRLSYKQQVDWNSLDRKKLLLMLICLVDCLCLFLFVFFMVLVGYFNRPKSKFWTSFTT